MVFSSITFLFCFLPLFFITYYLLPDKLKNTWLVISSIVFYSWGAPLFIFAVIISCFIDYFVALHFEDRNRKLFLVIGIITNLSLLFYFKYFNFFIGNFNAISESLFGTKIPWSNVVLPIGISFLTFQKMSYLVDVYRKDCEVQKNYWNYLLFVILFPQLIAGPIVRYKEISEQINHRYGAISRTNTYEGLMRFIIGLAKKVLIANILGEQANAIFNQSISDISFTQSWLGIIAYTFQIYFDFSGYSDMAIGLGTMLGFKFPENFNFPYSSKSVTEFWKRWHITLSNWMKDYLYIPLGGNRNHRTYVNLMVVFLLSGLWHGASWNFVLWGAIHGFFMVAERIGLVRLLKKGGGILEVGYTFFVVTSAWVFFRSESISYSLNFIKTMYSIHSLDIYYLTSFNLKFYLVLLIAGIFSFVPSRFQQHFHQWYSLSNSSLTLNITKGTAVLILYIFVLGELLATGFNPFIYFKF